MIRAEEIKEIKKLSPDEIKEHWKGMVWINYIVGQVGMSDLFTIDLLEKEMARRKMNVTDLKKWWKLEQIKLEESIK